MLKQKLDLFKLNGFHLGYQPFPKIDPQSSQTFFINHKKLQGLICTVSQIVVVMKNTVPVI